MPRSSPRSRSTFRAPHLRWAIAFVVAGACAAAFAIIAATPAGAATTQTASCVDGSGVRWSAKARWGSTYSSGGVRKVKIGYAGWTTNRAGDRTHRLLGSQLRRDRKAAADSDLDGRVRLRFRHRVQVPQSAESDQRTGCGQGHGYSRRRWRRVGQLHHDLHPTGRHCPAAWEFALADIETHLADVETRLADVETRLADVETRFTDVETRLADSDSYLANIETRLANIETRLANIDSHFDCGTKGLRGLPGCRLHRRSGWSDIDDRDR